MSEEPLSQRSTFLPGDVRFGRGSRIALLLAAVGIVGFAIRAAAEVLVPILFGALFAAATQPAARYLEEKLRFPKSLSVLTALLAVMFVLALACGTLFLGFMDIATDLPRYEAAGAKVIKDLARALSEAGLYHLAVLVQRRANVDFLPAAVSGTLDAIPRIVGFVTLAGLVTLFGLLERDALLRRLATGDETSLTYERVLSDTQKYLGVKSAVSALTGLAAGALCAGFGVPNAPLWGAIAFWLNFIPVVGSMIAGVPPVLIALVLVSPQVSFLVGLGYLIINFVLGNLLEPRWQGQSTGLSPLIVVISIAVWSALLGPLGALLSVPLTMAVKIGCAHTKDLAWFAHALDNDFAARLSVLPRRRRRLGAPAGAKAPRTSAAGGLGPTPPSSTPTLR